MSNHDVSKSDNDQPINLFPDKDEKPNGFFKRIFSNEAFKTELTTKPLMYGIGTLLGVYLTVFGFTSNHRKAAKYGFIGYLGVLFTTSAVAILKDGAERARSKKLFAQEPYQKKTKAWYETEDED